MNLMRGKQEMVLFSPAPTLHHVISPLHSWLLNNRFKFRLQEQVSPPNIKKSHPNSNILPWWHSGKETACNRFDPWVRKIPWRRKWQPTPVFLPGKSHGQRSLAGYCLWSCRVGDDRMTKQQQQSKYGSKSFFPTHLFPPAQLDSWLRSLFIPYFSSPPLLPASRSSRVRTGGKREEKWQSLSLSWLSLKTFAPSVITEGMALVWGANVWILWGFLKNPWNSQASIAGDALPATGFSITYPLIFLCGCLSSTRRPFHFKGSIRVGGAHFSSPVSNWPWKTLCFPGLPVPSAHTAIPCFLFYPCPCGWLQPSPHLQTPQAKCSSVSSQLGQETRSPLVAAPQSFLAPISWSLGGGGAQNLALSQQVNNSSSVMTFSALSLFQPSLYKDHGWVMAVRDERPVWQPLS